jgi:hypothetical protein
VAFLEGPHGDIISDDPEETGRHLETFRRLAQLALRPSESVGFLAGAAGEMALPGRA